MRAVLKALGLTIWGLVAIGVLAIILFVGYHAVARYRTSIATLVDESGSNDRSEAIRLSLSGGIAASPTTQSGDSAILHASEPISTPDAIRHLLVDAMHDGNYESAIAYGQQLSDGNFADPPDLLKVAQSYASTGNCEHASLWARRAQDAYQAAGVVPDGSLRRVFLCCGAGIRNYELAIASIERGLQKGGIVHLDEAYVVLGLSKQAIGDIEGARNAISKLKDIPGISPRVLRLWTLYAEMQLTTGDSWQCSNERKADSDSSSVAKDRLAPPTMSSKIAVPSKALRLRSSRQRITRDGQLGIQTSGAQ